MTRKEAIKLIQNLIYQMNEDGYAEIDAFHEDALLMAIKELEQSKTGHWIENRAKNYPGWIHCSECGEDWTHDGRPPYCPACGARMIKEE